MTISEPVVVALNADTHINSLSGLSYPVVNLDDGDTQLANRFRCVIWDAWREYWDIVAQKAREYDAQVVAHFVGDLNDMNIHDHAGLISQSPADVIRMTKEALQPALDVASKVFIERGTEAHVGKKANLEEEVAADIGAVQDPATGRHSWYWFRGYHGGVSFDLAHHPMTFSRRPWTVDNAANISARIIREQYLDDGETPPDIAARAHVHQYIPSNKRLKPWFFYLPGWQIATAFTYRRGATGFEKVGGMWFVCAGGKVLEHDVELWRVKDGEPWRES